MIVLSRQVGDSIVIDQPPERWTVTVCAISGDKVRLGVRSPDGSSSVTRLGGMQLSPDIVVSVVDIRGDKVRIGVMAPRTSSVHRLEIWEAIRRERGQDID